MIGARLASDAIHGYQPGVRYERDDCLKEDPMRQATNETLTAAVRGGRIAGMDTPVLLSDAHGQFAFGRDA